MRPRKPEVSVTKDNEQGFRVNIYDGEYMIQVRPHENGYHLDLGSKSGAGSRAFLRTFERNDDYLRLIEEQFDGLEADAIFETLETHFNEETGYRIVKVRPSIKGAGGQGVDLYVETGESVSTLVDNRDYRSDRWRTEDEYHIRVWPKTEYIEIRTENGGELIEDYWPNSYLDDIRREEKDDHERDRGPTSVPGVHGPISASDTVDSGPVIHTHVDCAHLKQLKETRFNPVGEDPPLLPAGEHGELPLRWCLSCRYREPTPDKIRDRYK